MLRLHRLPRVARLAIGAGVLLAPAFGQASTPSVTAEKRIQSLELPATRPERFAVDLVLDDAPRRVALAFHSVRSEDYQLLVQDADGSFFASVPSEPATYRGVVAGWPDARVSAVLTPEGLRASVVRTSSGEAWSIEPGPSGDRSAHSVVREDVSDLEAECLVGSGVAVDTTQPSGAFSTAAIRVAELVVDADHLFFSASGSLAATEADIEAIVNTVGMLYEFYFGVDYAITATVVRRAPARDPYAGAVFDLCSANCPTHVFPILLAEWAATRHTEIPRDTVHLLSGNPGASPAGAAWGTGVLCQTPASSAYAVSWSRRGYASGLGRSLLMAHELGHLWGACHCNVSSCVNYEPGNDCGVMQSSGGGPFFNQATVASLASIGSRPCLDDGVSTAGIPTLTSVRPSPISALGGETLVLTGTHLDEVLFVECAGTVFDTYEFERVSAQEIHVAAPMSSTLGAQTITVRGPGGTASATFEVAECWPPDLRASAIWIPADPFFPENVVWTYGAPIGFRADLLLSRSAATRVVDGHTILKFPVLLKSEVLAYPGTGSHSEVFASGAGSDFRVQLAVYDASGTLVGTSAILCHFIAVDCTPNPCQFQDC